MRAIYLRTSTGKQDGRAQTTQLERAVKARGWRRTNYAWYRDIGESGKKASRPMLDLLRKGALKGDVQELLVTALDRLGRSSADVCLLIDELAGAGVVIHSLREGTLDPSTPVGRFTVQIIASLAEMEHGLISERVRAGVRRAQEKGTRSGKPIGRPARDVDLVKVRAYRKKQWSFRRIAVALKVPEKTIRRQLAAGSTK